MSWMSQLSWKEGLRGAAAVEVEKMEKEIEKLTKEKNMKTIQAETLEQSLDKQKRKMEEEKTASVNLQRDVQILTEKCMELQNKVDKHQNELVAKENQVKCLQGTLENKSKQLETSLGKIKKLEGDLDLSTSSSSSSSDHRNTPQLQNKSATLDNVDDLKRRLKETEELLQQRDKDWEQLQQQQVQTVSPDESKKPSIISFDPSPLPSTNHKNIANKNKISSIIFDHQMTPPPSRLSNVGIRSSFTEDHCVENGTRLEDLHRQNEELKELVNSKDKQLNDLRVDFAQLKSTLETRSRDDKLAVELEITKSRCIELEAKIKNDECKIYNAESAKTAIEKKIKEKEIEWKTELGDSNSARESVIKDFEKFREEARTREQALQSAHDKLEFDQKTLIKELNQQNEALKHQILDLETRCEEFSKKVTELTPPFTNDRENTIKEMQSSTGILEKEENENTVIDLKKKLNEFQTQIQNLENENCALRNVKEDKDVESIQQMYITQINEMRSEFEIKLNQEALLHSKDEQNTVEQKIRVLNDEKAELQTTNETLRSDLAIVKESNDQRQNRIQDLQTERSNLLSRIESLKTEMESQITSVHETYSNQINEIKIESESKMRREISKMETIHDGLISTIRNLETQNRVLQDEKTELETAMTDNSIFEEEQYKNRIEILETTNSNLIRNMENLKSETETRISSLEEICDSRILEIRSEYESKMVEEASLTQKRRSELLTTIETLETKMSSITKEKTELQTMNGKLYSDLTDVKDRYDDLNRRIEDLQNEKSNLLLHVQTVKEETDTKIAATEETCQLRIKEIESEYETKILNDASKLENVQNERTVTIQNLQAKIRSLKDENRELETELTELRSFRINTEEEERQKYQNRIETLEIDKSNLILNIDNLKLEMNTKISSVRDNYEDRINQLKSGHEFDLQRLENEISKRELESIMNKLRSLTNSKNNNNNNTTTESETTNVRIKHELERIIDTFQTERNEFLTNLESSKSIQETLRNELEQCRRNIESEGEQYQTIIDKLTDNLKTLEREKSLLNQEEQIKRDEIVQLKTALTICEQRLQDSRSESQCRNQRISEENEKLRENVKLAELELESIKRVSEEIKLNLTTESESKQRLEIEIQLFESQNEKQTYRIKELESTLKQKMDQLDRLQLERDQETSSRIEELETQISKLETERFTLQSKLDESRNEINDFESWKKKELRHSHLEKENLEALQRETDDKVKSLKLELENQVTNADKIVKELKETIQSREEENAKLLSRIDDLAENEKTLNSAMEELTKEREKSVEQMESLKIQIAEMNIRIDTLSESEKSLHSVVEDLKEEKRILINKIDLLRQESSSQMDSIRGSNQQLKELRSELEGQVRDKTRENEKLVERVNGLQHSLEEVKTEYETLQDEMETVVMEKLELEEELKSVRDDQNRRLEEEEEDRKREDDRRLIDSLKQECSQMKTQILDFETKYDELDEKYESLLAEKTELLETIEDVQRNERTKVSNLESRIETLTVKLQDALSDLEESRDSLIKSRTDSDNIIAALKTEIEEIKIEKDVIITHEESNKIEIRTLEERISDLKKTETENSELKASLKSLEKEMEQLQLTVKEKEDLISKHQASVKEVEESCEKIRKELASAEKNFEEEKQGWKSKLQSLLSSQRRREREIFTLREETNQLKSENDEKMIKLQSRLTEAERDLEKRKQLDEQSFPWEDEEFKDMTPLEILYVFKDDAELSYRAKAELNSKAVEFLSHDVNDKIVRNIELMKELAETKDQLDKLKLKIKLEAEMARCSTKRKSDETQNTDPQSSKSQESGIPNPFKRKGIVKPSTLKPENLTNASSKRPLNTITNRRRMEEK